MRLVPVLAALSADVDRLSSDLVRIQRDLHRNPELSWQETRSTTLVTDRLHQAGVTVRPLGQTGCYADLGSAEPSCRVCLRGDLDALPVQERSGLPWASRHAGVTHACGHDVHTAALLGAGLVLNLHQRALEQFGIAVRLLFQPAEEVQPSGAQDLLDHPVLTDVDRVFAVHCDPRLDVGKVGLRVGAVTAASDAVTVRLRGPGGHTSRPHLTSDLTYALAKVVTDVPAALSRRVDPRAGVAMVWGSVQAGTRPNVIPSSGEASGTVRMLDASAWRGIEGLIRELVEAVVAPYGATVEVVYAKGVPPVVNTAGGVTAFTRAAHAVLGPDAVGPTEQSLGGEDFGWLVQRCDGAMARVGTRTPGGLTYDLHQADLIVDERATIVAAKLLAAVAVEAGRQRAQAPLS